MQASSATIPAIVWQYSDECAALWRNREYAAHSRTYDATLQDLEDLDQRLDAKIDGLRTTGNAGRQTVLEEAEQQAPGTLFTLGILFFEACCEEPAAAETLSTCLQSIKQPAHALRPFSLALDWIDPDVLPVLAQHLSRLGELGAALALVAEAKAGRCQLSRATRALESSSPVLIAAACEAANITQERALLRPMEELLRTGQEAVVWPAAFAALSQGSRRAQDTMAHIASTPDSPRSEEAASHLFRALAPKDAVALHRTLFAKGPPTRTSVQAASAAAAPELVPHLLEAMQAKALARLAAEGLCHMLGLDLKRDRLLHPPPEDHQAGPTGDPLDPNTEMDPEEGRPWPDAALFQAWWELHGANYASNTRYMAGERTSEDALGRLLRQGSQSLRAAAAELLAFSGRPLFDVHAPVFRQRQRLAMAGAWR